jgi:hypothetical protein
MELFNYYEEDFIELRDSIQKKLEAIPTYDGGLNNHHLILINFRTEDLRNHTCTKGHKRC